MWHCMAPTAGGGALGRAGLAYAGPFVGSPWCSSFRVAPEDIAPRGLSASPSTRRMASADRAMTFIRALGWVGSTVPKTLLRWSKPGN